MKEDGGVIRLRHGTFMLRKKTIILCQPDSRKGCSACCGLFNLSDITRAGLEGFLSCGRERVSALPEGSDPSGEYPGDRRLIRDITSHVCPYQGFTGREKRRPGCLLHPSVHRRDLRNRSFFGAKICGDFLCPAYCILDDERKEILVRHLDDWYPYSIAIIDPESFLWMVESLTSRFHPDFRARRMRKKISTVLTRALELHAEFLNRLSTPIFHYSLGEYRLQSRCFSLASRAKEIEGHRNIIEKEMAGLWG